ncbi:hypothetical protein LP421_26740 [Rhizobium sp. RCAM05350]|nr:hypothetical protein LP421_26740 [Rhizobium sp. RCAM05350]
MNIHLHARYWSVVPVAIGGKAMYLTTSDRIEYHLTIPSREYEIIGRA